MRTYKIYLPKARVHNKRRAREYPTLMILPNALCKVMMQQPVITLGVECFD